jgi:methyl-accepting chemotaxis protein
MSLWQKLVAPKPGLDAETRRKSRLYNQFLLAALIIIPIFTPIPQLNGINYRVTITLGISFIGLGLAYLQNKGLGWLQPAGYTGLLAAVFSVLYFLLTTPDSSLNTDLKGFTPLLALPIIMSGVIIGSRAPFVLSLIGIITVLPIAFLRLKSDTSGLPDFIFDIENMSTPTVFLLATAGLSWFFEDNISHLVYNLQQRNQELEESNRALAAQRTIEAELQRKVNQLVQSISHTFGEQNTNTSTQLSALMRVTTSFEELNRTAEEIAQAASQVSDTAIEALEVAQEGDQIIRVNVTAIEQHQQRVSSIGEAMKDLFQQAQEVDQIVEIITEIAEETNLLALNATIEAAGAREYGRRFSAVATEVQRLAQRSSASAENIREIVEQVREAIRNSSVAVEIGLREATKLVENIRLTELSIQGLVERIQRNAMLAQQISSSIQHQKGANLQVFESLHLISDLSKQVTATSDYLLSAMTQLQADTVQLSTFEEVAVGILL